MTVPLAVPVSGPDPRHDPSRSPLLTYDAHTTPDRRQAIASPDTTTDRTGTGPAVVGAPLVRVRGVSKSYPGVRALAGVDLDVRAGEVHALTGENGSGKSTLAKIIGGVVAPDEGVVEVDGKPVAFSAPADALEHGIVMISQELTLAPTLSVAENVFLGRLPRTRLGTVDWATARRQARAVLDSLGVHVDETARVDELSLELRQEVEIARAVSSDARLLILDEATSSLSEAATDRLLDMVRAQSARGVAVLMISHRMPELYSTATGATVLRDGHLVATLPLPATPERELVRLMVGRELTDYFGAPSPVGEETVLEVVELTGPGLSAPVSLSVRRGEVLGIAGLVGSGKAELGMMLGGAVPSLGTVRVDGRDVRLSDPRRTLRAGIGYVPDDRKKSALLPVRSVSENLSVSWLGRLARLGVLDVSRERREVRDAVHRYGVVAASPAARISTLSGGNQQKVVLGRLFALDCAVYVLSEPTRGVDVGSKSAIYALLREQAARGAAVVLISSELPELMGMSDRIVVFFEGRVRGEFDRADFDEHRLAQVAVSGAVHASSPSAPSATPVDGSRSHEGQS